MLELKCEGGKQILSLLPGDVKTLVSGDVKTLVSAVGGSEVSTSPARGPACGTKRTFGGVSADHRPSELRPSL